MERSRQWGLRPALVLVILVFVTVASILGPFTSSLASLNGSQPLVESSSAEFTLKELNDAPLSTVADPTDEAESAASHVVGPAEIPRIQVVLTLRPANPSQLESLLSALANPASPHYHQYWSAAQFDRQFSPPLASVDSLTSYLEALGAQNVSTSADRLTVSFIAASSVVDSIFHTQLETHEQAGEFFYAPRASPQLPAPLASEVLSIEGLSDGPNTLLHSDLTALARDAPTPSDGTGELGISPTPLGYLPPPTIGGTQYEYAPDFQVAYDEQSLFDQFGFPTGTVVATILWSGTYGGPNTTTPYGRLTQGQLVGPFVPGDVTDFYNETLPSGEPHARVVGVPILGAPAPGPLASWDTTGAVVENTLDLEMVGSTAPGASIYNVYAPEPTIADLDLAFSYILNPNASFAELQNVSAISNSWGGVDENDPAWAQDLEEAQVRGITVLASTGDSGDSPASSKYAGGVDLVEFPSSVATDTYGVVAVGGTTVTLGASLHLSHDVVWMENLSGEGPLGSTGGISAIFAEPAWQAASEANSVINGTGRGVPDLAAMANNTLFTISMDGIRYVATNASEGRPFYSVAGTSVAAPLTAGLVAEIDHVLVAERDPPLGFLDPALYALANREYSPLTNSSLSGYEVTGPYAASLPTLPCLDVTKGANAVYSARPGYDLVTGWGSLDAYNFTMYAVNVTSLGVAGHLAGVRDILNLTALNVVSRFPNGTLDPSGNASIQQNFFLANGLGAPVFWVHDVVALKDQSGGNWSVFDQEGTTFPFSGLYPALRVDAYNDSLPWLTTLPTALNLTTVLMVPSGPTSAVLDFTVNGFSTSLPVPGAAWVMGNRSAEYSWQGVNYTNGPVRNGSASPGALAPQFGLLGAPLGSTATFSPPTAGNLSATVLPFGQSFVRATMVSFGHNISQAAETAAGLSWTASSAGQWTATSSVNSTTQGVLTLEPAGATVAFPVDVSETGLPSHASWQVTISGGNTYTSMSPQLNFTLPNGTYDYSVSTSSAGYQPSVPSGVLNVDGGTVRLTIPFVAVEVGVTFLASGLPTGTSWMVELAGTSNTSTGPSIGFLETAGVYPYTVAPVAGYIAVPPRGNVTVGGVSITVLVPFSAVLYPVEFVEAGLPAGVDWSVSILGVVHSSVGSTITFSEPNGTYSFTVGAPAGYASTTATPSVSVHGAAVQVNVTLSSTAAGKSGSFFGLSETELAVALGLGLLVLLALVAAVLVRRRRRRDRPPNAPPAA